MSGRLVLLTTSPRVAAGLLAVGAWDAVRAADRVFADAADHPQAVAIAAAGVDVRILGELPPPALAQRLLTEAADSFVVWLVDPAEEIELASALAALLVGGAAVELELLPGSYDLPGGHLLDLVEVMDRLRSPGGCPWDAEQSHESLVPYLVEETYEVIEAVESSDAPHLREELGDLLLQVVFHARVAAEGLEDKFTIDDVADGIVAKLVRRHPHVFGGDDVPAGRAGAARVETRWEEIKAAEKSRESVLDGIPPGLPALAYATKVVARARRAGLAGAVGDAAEPGSDEALGVALLALVADASGSGLDAEGALRRAARSYADVVRAAEAAGRRGSSD